MKITVIPGKELTLEHQLQWRRIQHADPALDSPYFCPEFTSAVAAVRDDVQVAILEDSGETVGYFAFQRGRLGCGKPVGAPLSDFQGVVIRKDVTWTAEELISGCHLTMWDYDHFIPSQHHFSQHHKCTAASPYMNLSGGFETYMHGRSEAGAKPFSRLRTLSRKLEREIGALRFECNVSDPAALHKLLAWKSNQYRASGGVDILDSKSWTVRLLERIHYMQTEYFLGMLSALYVDGALAAAHFGMRSHSIWHYWFPAYDPRLARYSPGLILLLRMAEAADSIGIRRIDLGRGGELYKQRFMSGGFPLAEGCVMVPSVTSSLRKGVHAGLDWLRASRFSYPLRTPGRMFLRVCRSLIYR
jgi:CelD/BcsL family acetyltransferase involved in cellulose biosynthesis